MLMMEPPPWWRIRRSCDRHEVLIGDSSDPCGDLLDLLGREYGGGHPIGHRLEGVHDEIAVLAEDVDQCLVESPCRESRWRSSDRDREHVGPGHDLSAEDLADVDTHLLDVGL